MEARVEVARYESFINDVLRQDLARLHAELQRAAIELADLQQQQHTLALLAERSAESLKTQVNVGCDMFVQGCVSDTSTLLYHAGLGHYLELSAAEAQRHVRARSSSTEQHMRSVRARAAQTRAHIKLMLLGVRQLQHAET